jgi:hypothetical protein
MFRGKYPEDLLYFYFLFSVHDPETLAPEVNSGIGVFLEDP